MKNYIFLYAAILGSAVAFNANAKIPPMCTDPTGKSYANATCASGETAAVCNCIINGHGTLMNCAVNFSETCLNS